MSRFSPITPRRQTARISREVFFFRRKSLQTTICPQNSCSIREIGAAPSDLQPPVYYSDREDTKARCLQTIVPRHTLLRRVLFFMPVSSQQTHSTDTLLRGRRGGGVVKLGMTDCLSLVVSGRERSTRISFVSAFLHELPWSHLPRSPPPKSCYAVGLATDPGSL